MLEYLKKALREVIKSYPEGISEYDLLQQVKPELIECLPDTSGTLSLFQQHFALMHCLYCLREELTKDLDATLEISPLKIQWREIVNQNTKAMAEQSDGELKNYYLDWNNFTTTQAQDVELMLSQFWRAYARYLSRDDAWEVLGLNIGASQQTITTRYRELAARHHPDKGGDQETFVKVRAAYEVLRVGKK